MTAVGLGLSSTALADNYGDLAAQGYRWITVNGPYACGTDQDVQRIVAHDTERQNCTWWKISGATISYRELSCR